MVPMSKKFISGLRTGAGGVPMFLQHLETDVEIISPNYAVGLWKKI
jgi:hypothetical protein